MKKYFNLFFISNFFVVVNGFSQLDPNAIKVNISGFAIRNISLQYERKLSNNLSVALAFRDIPYGKLPFSSQISKAINNPYIPFDQINFSAFGITPEMRFYLSKEAMKGFYIGVFGNYSNYKTDLPVVYGNQTGQFNGEVKTYTGGLQFGWQFQVSSHLFIDWWIVGPNYGACSGNLVFTGTLSPNEQSALNFELGKTKSDAPFHIIESYAVSAAGASMVVKGPWAGLRGLGFNLAFHF